jgi:cell division protein FtsZ
MSDELRVTVVATGIGAERKPDISLVPNHRHEPVRSAHVYGNAGTSYSHHQGNAARDMSQAPLEVPNVQSKPVAEKQANIDIFDIPAFLRKQAD